MLPSIRIHSPFKFDDMWKTKTKSEIVYKRIPDCVNSHFRVEIIHNFKFAPSPFNPAIIQLQRVYIYVQFRRKVHKRHRPANKYTSIILVIFGMFFFFLHVYFNTKENWPLRIIFSIPTFELSHWGMAIATKLLNHIATSRAFLAEKLKAWEVGVAVEYFWICFICLISGVGVLKFCESF